MVMNLVSAMSNLGYERFIEIRSLNRIIFPQGVTFITIPEKEPSQIRVVLKRNPEEVIGLPFEPVGHLPDGLHT
jgi:hypothetical protein